MSQQNLRAYITGFFFFFFVLRVCPHTFVSVFFLLLGLLLLPSHFSFLALFCFLFLLWFLIMLILMFLFAPCRSSRSLLCCVLVGFAGRSSVSIVCCELLLLQRFFFFFFGSFPLLAWLLLCFSFLSVPLNTFSFLCFHLKPFLGVTV